MLNLGEMFYVCSKRLFRAIIGYMRFRSILWIILLKYSVLTLSTCSINYGETCTKKSPTLIMYLYFLSLCQKG